MFQRLAFLNRGFQGTLLALVLIGGCLGCKVNEDTLIEKPLGKLAELGIEAQYEMIKDPLLQDYVASIGQTQVDRAVRRRKVPYRFHIVDTDEVNAFAIPWGGVYVTYGLLKAAETEDELAAVMGHEIGHVEGRHAVRSVKKQLWGNLLLSLLKGEVSQDVMTALQVAGLFLSLQYSRDQEYDADRRGIEIAYRSDFDPYGEVVFFERLRRLYGDEPRFLSYLSTHPLHRDRIARAKKQPELSEQNATPLTHIATGYAQRGMYAPAIARYEKALAVDPRYVPAYLGLARAAQARGERQRARQAYRAALQYDQSHAEARKELAALESQPEERPEPAPSTTDLAVRWAAARAANEQALAALQGQQPEIAAALERTRRNDRRVQQGMGATSAMLQELQSLQDPSGAIGDLVGYSLKIITLANNAVSTLDFAREETSVTVDQLVKAHQALNRFLEAPPQTAADVALLERIAAMAQTSQNALAELREAASEMNASQERIRRAHFAALGAVQELHRTFFAQRMSLPAAPDFRYTLEAAEREARDVLERARDISRTSATGRAQAFQIQIDALLAGATPAQRRVAVGLMRHFLRVPEETVATLQREGRSFGETALLLAGARSRKREPAEWIRTPVAYQGLVQTLKTQGVRLDHLNIMLKFLVHALEVEMAPSQENPRSGGRAT
jgi:tetratricopeptide (TPR) repeat protein